MSLSIEQNNFEAFFDAPFAAYGSDASYVSPLKSDLKRFLDDQANPFFTAGKGALQYFTAHRNGRVIGRITAHEHGASNELHDWKRGYFGYFDCVDDAEAARALLEAAENWCRARGLTRILGNFNLTAMQQIGVMTDNFDRPPYLDLVYSPPHIARLLEENGYAGATIATAVNGEFVAAALRSNQHLENGDRIEVLAPMQGG